MTLNAQNSSASQVVPVSTIWPNVAITPKKRIILTHENDDFRPDLPNKSSNYRFLTFLDVQPNTLNNREPNLLPVAGVLGFAQLKWTDYFPMWSNLASYPACWGSLC